MTRMASFCQAMELGFGLLSGRSGVPAERRKLWYSNGSYLPKAVTPKTDRVFLIPIVAADVNRLIILRDDF